MTSNLALPVQRIWVKYVSAALCNRLICAWVMASKALSILFLFLTSTNSIKLCRFAIMSISALSVKRPVTYLFFKMWNPCKRKYIRAHNSVNKPTR